jgi:hypothetical protein
MATMLRRVLTAFEETGEPRSLNDMARELEVTPGMLQGMIEYWVRRGRLREAGSTFSNCQTCGTADGCPFVVRMPRRYELADSEAPQPTPPCRCCR